MENNRLAILRKIEGNLLKGADEISKIYDGMAGGLSLNEAFYIVADTQRTLRYIERRLEFVRRMMKREVRDDGSR